MKLGQKVTYIRYAADGTIDKGEGYIVALNLDPDKQQQAIVQDCEAVGEDGKPKRVAAFVTSLNYSPEYEQKFVKGMEKITMLTDKGNGLVRKIVDSYNKRTLAVKKRLFGKQVEV